LAAVAASVSTNAIANLDMTGSSLLRGTNARQRDPVSVTVEEELGARMAAINDRDDR